MLYSTCKILNCKTIHVVTTAAETKHCPEGRIGAMEKLPGVTVLWVKSKEIILHVNHLLGPSPN